MAGQYTMYDGTTQLLVENPINRYLINSPMLPELKENADGSLTLFIQKDEPTDPVQKANWLPAPNGPIYIVLRMYWPKESVLNGSWEPPGIQAAKQKGSQVQAPCSASTERGFGAFTYCAVGPGR